ncbi:MAG: fructose 1,6-bisphosphatase [Candidatus Altiarchaeota archaeon]|nr:fructose 1,6-bisphosphatase [Candidatus Altiarchaeota archaeon]
MVTISVIKADVGGYPGHHSVHPDLIKAADQVLRGAKENGLLTDFRILACGDDLQLLMTHWKGCDNSEVHGMAWEAFLRATDAAKNLKLYGAGQDLLSDTFSGNIRGMGPGIAEMDIEERPSEPIVVFMADKTESGAWNFPLYKMFADPFNTPGLVIAPGVHMGFEFEVYDLFEKKKVVFKTPEDSYDLLALIGASERYVVKRIRTKDSKKVAAVTSTESLHLIAGKYVGKDDPVAIVRSQHEFPALGEVLEPFSFPFLVKGWMRGSHHGPFMPTSFEQAHPSRFDGPPRVIAAGFQMNNGYFVGPVDLFKDPSFDRARQKANEVADYMRRHGTFEPHRLGMSEMEYTTIPAVLDKLKDKFVPI